MLCADAYRLCPPPSTAYRRRRADDEDGRRFIGRRPFPPPEDVELPDKIDDFR
jgi:hypothetical protein